MDVRNHFRDGIKAKIAGIRIDMALMAEDAGDAIREGARSIRAKASDAKWTVIDAVDDVADALWEDEGDARLVATCAIALVMVPLVIGMAHKARRIL